MARAFEKTWRQKHEKATALQRNAEKTPSSIKLRSIARDRLVDMRQIFHFQGLHCVFLVFPN